MKTVSKNEMKELLKDLLTYGCNEECLDNCSEHRYGKIFHVTFVKKDGSIRPMECRTGVKKGQKGKGLAFDAIAKGLLPVYDLGLARQMTEEERLAKPPYRFVNMDTVIEANLEKEHVRVSD